MSDQSALSSPADNQFIIGQKTGVTLLGGGYLDVIMQMPLPGIVIFVHGVNSDGEWYDQAEQGLCKGLNTRLKRNDEDMAYPTSEGGQLSPATYMSELTDDGFINPKRTPQTFMQDDDHFTPVIRFRWGYKASLRELQQYGDAVYLNEENYWGGGPFANGCTALPDLWSAGLSEKLFLWLHVQHLNPVNNRNVYACPPRPYFVLAALRLAKLVASIRQIQADVPVTLVCHSQGNMIGMAAAFLGDRMNVTNAAGSKLRCVADSYVLCNPPYSLLEQNRTENWTESHMTDRHGGSGRQTLAARVDTLRAFFDIVRQGAATEQKAETIDQYVANKARGFDIRTDRVAHGYGAGPSTCGRVTLYCCPHDQVISALSIQGIGWRGMNRAEIDATGAAGVFCQRVFAQGHPVGKQGHYHYWTNHYRQPAPGSDDYWYPPSPPASYSLSKGMLSNRHPVGKVLTFFMAPLMIFFTKITDMRVNALPDKSWSIPIDAPALPLFMPRSLRFGQCSEDFDEGYDVWGHYRSADKTRPKDDPYAHVTPIAQGKGEPPRDATDAGKGDRNSEARMRYEDRGFMRMQAKREGRASNDARIEEETPGATPGEEYKAWSDKHIRNNLAANIDANATDHSTIMTNPEHAEKALAYDVAIGMCEIPAAKFQELRIAADWQLWEGLGNRSPHFPFGEYASNGKFDGKSLDEWIRAPESEGSMPEKIDDRRENAAPAPRPSAGD